MFLANNLHKVHEHIPKNHIIIKFIISLLLYITIQTLRNKREFRLARQGKMTRGKLNAIENTNPILIISDDKLGSKLINILPKKFNNF